MKTLRNVKRVELVTIPVLVVCVIPSAFKCVEDVTMENAGLLEKMKELKEAIERRRKEEEEERKRRAAEEERLKREREEAERRRKEAEEAARRKAVISCKRDWDCIDKRVRVIEVSNGCCNEEGLKELDLRGFVNLRRLKVGNECFKYVKKVSICGLRELERMIVGSKSFTKEKNVYLFEKDGRFYLKNCPKLRELRITGVLSFSDYSVCEIENCALKVIEIGGMNKESRNFYHASLELKSILIHSE